jgi:hypothetical protein
VLKGQSYADGKITSSLECGSVTVTAESAGRKAECTVEFTCTDATFEITTKPTEIPGDGKAIAQVTIRVKEPSGKYITFLKDRTVELTSTAGTITSPCVIPAKAPGAEATITSEKKPGPVTITAVSPPLKGEAGVVLWCATAVAFALPFYLFWNLAPFGITAIGAPFLLKTCLCMAVARGSYGRRAAPARSSEQELSPGRIHLSDSAGARGGSDVVLLVATP